MPSKASIMDQIMLNGLLEGEAVVRGCLVVTFLDEDGRGRDGEAAMVVKGGVDGIRGFDCDVAAGKNMENAATS
ncbi:hypothetical protein Droror1_Dr00025967 [Drosera rotundifolia]